MYRRTRLVKVKQPSHAFFPERKLVRQGPRGDELRAAVGRAFDPHLARHRACIEAEPTCRIRPALKLQHRRQTGEFERLYCNKSFNEGVAIICCHIQHLQGRRR